jgi:hypothetical protein
VPVSAKPPPDFAAIVVAVEAPKVCEVVEFTHGKGEVAHEVLGKPTHFKCRPSKRRAKAVHP